MAADESHAADQSHAALASALRRRVVETGVVETPVRVGAMASGGGGHGELVEPYNGLASMIAERSYRVTDQLVDAVRGAAGSDKATFEVVMSASVGAGLRRWDAAMRAIQEAADAAS